MVSVVVSGATNPVLANGTYTLAGGEYVHDTEAFVIWKPFPWIISDTAKVNNYFVREDEEVLGEYGNSQGSGTVVVTEAPEGTNTQINIGDDWKEISAAQINIGDAWKAVAGMQINIGDTWKTIF